MRVSLPISTVGRALAAAQHAADGVAQAQHEVGRDRRLADRAADAVGAEVGSAHGVGSCARGRRDYRRRGVGRSPDRQRVDRRRDVVHAHDARAALHRDDRGGDARGLEPRALAGVRWRPASSTPVDARQRRLARPADEQRHAEARAARRWRAAARGCAPASCRSRCRDRATMRSRATPARASPRRSRSRRNARDLGDDVVVVGSALHRSRHRRACASGRRRSADARRPPSSAPGARSAPMSLTMSAPRSSAARITSGLVVSTETGQPRPSAAAQHRQHARELVVGADRRGAGPGRLAADVEDVGALRRPAARSARSRAPASMSAAAVGERIGRDVDDAHHARPRQVDREAASSARRMARSCKNGAEAPSRNAAASIALRRRRARCPASPAARRRSP